MSADVSGWKEIDSAPKNKFVTVTRKTRGVARQPFEYLTACFRAEYGTWFDIYDNCIGNSGGYPTHWRPLPPLPVMESVNED